MTKTINREVEINAFTFATKKGFQSIPQIITVDNQRYSFVDSGLRYIVQQGHHLIRLFDMTDGKNTFRLRNENDQWTLVSIKTA
jgi:hypothetical protein